jgi:hypothetical protein
MTGRERAIKPEKLRPNVFAGATRSVLADVFGDRDNLRRERFLRR